MMQTILSVVYFYFQNIFKMLGTIPESHEGEAKKQTEGSPKLGHEGGEGVYELLHLHPGELRQGAEGEGEVV